jgi:hypothetical protein
MLAQKIPTNAATYMYVSWRRGGFIAYLEKVPALHTRM